MRRALASLAGALALLPAAGARAAGEPTMPLSQVHRGMQCTVRSVLHGTTISTFGAQVLDIVDGDKVGDDTRILVRYSGPAIAGTGVGEGFSGSPLTCPDAAGVPRVIGALSYGIGDFGDTVGLVTPIGQILGEKVLPPAGVHHRAALLARARPLDLTTVTGFSAPVRTALARAARRTGRAIYASPGGPASGRFARQALVPGASVSVGYADGDFSAGAIGTVTYRDGAKLWAFGHPLDGVGRRSLFLQDAYVYGVIGIPSFPAADSSSPTVTYKLSAPGHDLGTLSGDGANGVAGTVGSLPKSTAFTARVRDLDTGHVTTAASRIADETDVGDPLGDSMLDLVATGGTASLVTRAYDGAPAAETGRMCARFSFREIKGPVTFCDRYVGTGSPATGAVVPGSAADDLAGAFSLVQGVDFAALHVTKLRVDVAIARGLHQELIRGASAPRSARRGQTITVALRVQHYQGSSVTRRVRVRIPATLKRGSHRLILAGPADDSGDLTGVLSEILGTSGSSAESDTGGGAPPATAAGLARAIRGLARYDGVSAIFGRRKTGAHVLRDPSERISGAAAVTIRVR